MTARISYWSVLNIIYAAHSELRRQDRHRQIPTAQRSLAGGIARDRHICAILSGGVRTCLTLADIAGKLIGGYRFSMTDSTWLY